MIHAAGILLLTPDKRALFVKRGPGSDHPGEWCFPGGQLEGSETAEDAAVREFREECGELPDGPRRLLARNVSPAIVWDQETQTPIDTSTMVDYTTFIQPTGGTFEPTLNYEHVGYAWAPLSEPPQPMHPGAQTAIDRLTMDELGVARAMAAGLMSSPQKYENIWLFNLRITGTGVSYRRGADEFVWRDPAIYLTDEFLARCNGLPVIFEHPGEMPMSSKEYSKRNVGSIFLPFIRGDEAWGVAKIYDEETAELMETEQISTSPAVCFTDPREVNTKFAMEDGKVLLVEGKPSLLDHLAICERGVWDKGGEPRGVEVQQLSIGDSDMPTPEEMAADKAKKDAEEQAKKDAAEAGQTLDKALSRLDALCAKMDAWEEKEKADSAKRDAEEKDEKEKADKAKRDAEMSEEEKEKADKAKRDAEEKDEKEKADKAKRDAEEKAKADSEAIRQQIADVASRLPKDVTDADFAAMAAHQADADRVFSAFGNSAPRPLSGETPLAYRRRLASGLQTHSANCKTVDLKAIADEVAFGIIEKQIYADAMEVARNPVNLGEGELREIRTADETGRIIKTFVGKPSSWMGDFMFQKQYMKGISTTTRKDA